MSIKDINPATPSSTDPVGEGDDQIRAFKSAVQACFPNLDGQINNSGGSGSTGDDANPPNAETFSKLFDDVRALGGSAGDGSVPVGGIILWSGALDAVPTGWALCDGLNGTPNLEDRFVVGAGNLFAQGSSGGSSTTDNGGGSGTATLNLPDHVIGLDNLPEHQHHMVTNNNVSSGNPQIAGANDPLVGSLENPGGGQGTIFAGDTGEATQGLTAKGGGVVTPEGLTHPATDITIDGIEHTHTYTPPYYALAYIQRTA